MARPRAAADEESGGGRSDISEGDVVRASVVQSTTESTPAEADKTSVPNALDAKGEQPPVRAQKPDTPIAQSLAAGAGEHTPPDPDEFDEAGRPKGEQATE
jgi:hypothetical protein